MILSNNESLIEVLKDNPKYALANGIPRQKKVYSLSQTQTEQTFAFKWSKRDTYESDAVHAASKKWLKERYELPDTPFSKLLEGKTVLDAGCGAGFSALLLFGELLNTCRYIGADISTAVDVASQRFAEKNVRGEFIQVDLLDLPEELGTFDIIFSEGVLHHTDSTEKAIRYLATKLTHGGYFMFYVYNKKGPIREFTDDLIRSRIADMTDEEAWNALEPLTKFGKVLGDLDLEIHIEEPIDVLGIPAGKINLQRLFYWHVFKAFYNPEFNLDEMNHANFDWYRPRNCHRQTPDEVITWVESSDLEILKMDVQEAGITVVARSD
jgi:arsenite methyltransferase